MKRTSEPTEYTINCRERLSFLISEYCDGSQQRFVEKTGCNKGSVSQWVNGSNVPGTLAARKIGETFKVNPAWVMGFDVPRVASLNPASPAFSPLELQIIDAFRDADDITRGHICLLLGVENVENVEKGSAAQRSYQSPSGEESTRSA